MNTVTNIENNQEVFEKNSREEKTIFIRSGDNIYLSSFNPTEKREFRLAAGFYSLEFDSLKEIFYLRLMGLQKMPEKVYGDVKAKSSRILNTFQKRGINTGVLLHGLKGTGKSLLSRQVSIDAVEAGLPVIFIASPFAGPKFTEFMENIEQACVINIDEFEKTYGGQNSDSQESLLSMMDGVSKQNKLWLLTVNETNNVNKYMLNRPGRLFYKFEYGIIPPSIVEEVCIDKGLSQLQTKDLLSVYSLINELTFDVLMAIIEESQRYDELPSDSLKLLNIDMENQSYLLNPRIQIIVDNKCVYSKNNYDFNLDDPQLSLDFNSKLERAILEDIIMFRKDFKNDYEIWKLESEDSGEFEFQLFDYNDFNLEIVGLNGMDGVREYQFTDLEESGTYKKEGASMPKIRVIVIPEKKKKFDYTKIGVVSSKYEMIA